MPKYVTEEWCDVQRSLAEFPERLGVTARIQYHVTGGPEGDINYHWLLENGKLLESGLGEDIDADFTLTMSYAAAAKIARLELNETAAFMQSELTVKGNIGKLMKILPLTESEEFRVMKEKVKQVTDF